MRCTTILDKPTKLENTATKFFPLSLKNNPKREIAYYHREYINDFPPTENNTEGKLKRTFVAALPFISLYKPAGSLISISLDGLRSVHHITDLVKNFQNQKALQTLSALFSTAISITSLVITLFYYPMGNLLITSHDIFLSCGHLVESIKAKDKEKIIENIIQLANHALYATSLFLGFSLELQVASLSMQVIYQIFSSIVEGKKGHYIELIGHLGMIGIRGGQLYSQSLLLKRKWDIEKQIKNIFVDKLHQKWQFPSDHLPVGVEVDGVEVISWNVLNNAYLDWVYNDSQGLKGSMITDLDVAIQKDGFTKRDDLVIKMIHQMIGQTEKRGVIALQECSNPFLSELEKRLPASWGIITSSREKNDHNVVLYNKKHLSYDASRSLISEDAYPCEKQRPIMNLCFERRGKKPVRIFNSHIPGNPNLPGRYEFANYIKKHYVPGKEVAVALGDMNFEREEMREAMQKADLFDYLIHSPYHTNVDPYTKKSKCIDHMIVFGEDVESSKMDSSKMGINLQPTIDLLLSPQLRANPIPVKKNRFSYFRKRKTALLNTGHKTSTP